MVCRLVNFVSLAPLDLLILPSPHLHHPPQFHPPTSPPPISITYLLIPLQSSLSLPHREPHYMFVARWYSMCHICAMQHGPSESLLHVIL